MPTANGPRGDRSTLSVLVVDDHVLLREGLVRLLDREEDIRVVGQAQTCQEAVRLAGELRPSVVIMDYGVPGMAAAKAVRRVLEQSPGSRVVGLSIEQEDGAAAAMLGADAVRFLSKTDTFENLLHAMRSCRDDA